MKILEYIDEPYAYSYVFSHVDGRKRPISPVKSYHPTKFDVHWINESISHMQIVQRAFWPNRQPILCSIATAMTNSIMFGMKCVNRPVDRARMERVAVFHPEYKAFFLGQITKRIPFNKQGARAKKNTNKIRTWMEIKEH